MDKNERLARWAGWSEDKDSVLYDWRDPRGEGVSESFTHYPWPRFTDSLNACFKWLLPNLNDYQVEYRYVLGFLHVWEIHECSEATKRVEYYTQSMDSASEALCEAILALIENNGQS